MTQAPLIGIVGGYGAVGSAVARFLHADGRVRLRIGGRDAERARAFAGELPGAYGQAVDAYDPASLAEFCAGCAVVVCTGGASYAVLDRVAQAAFAAGADYVDAGGDLPLYERLTAADPAASGRRALVTAGMMPGLSGLLPRWLAASGYASAERLTAYIGVVDHLTPQGAVDYLLSLGEREQESQAAWLEGRRVSKALAPEPDTELPFFPGRVAAYPYLGYEAQRLAVQLGLRDVRWYSVFDQGAHMLSALSQAQGAMAGEADLAAAGRALSAAAELDLFGREPYQIMLFELSGAAADGAPRTTTLVVRSAVTSLLTGTVCGIAALAVLEGRVPVGAHLAAEGLDPEETVAALRKTSALRLFEVLDGGAAQTVETAEEGSL